MWYLLGLIVVLVAGVFYSTQIKGEVISIESIAKSKADDVVTDVKGKL